jgi:gamma-glutamyltranspeptidase/glutathione hydrolase
MTIASSVRVSHGTRGAVVSGDPTATGVAARMLAEGASLADAALAGAVVLAVTQPQACSLGGDAFILIHDAATGRTSGINASGPAPALVTEERFSSGIPQRGPLTITTPGVLAGWAALHERYGRLPWQALFEPAIALAREGVAVTPGVSRGAAMHAELLRACEPAARLFLPAGQPMAAGARLLQPALARTLETVAREGPDGFYEGTAAASIGATCERLGGLLRKSDLAGCRAQWVEPISTRYRDHTVTVMPPNSFGLYLLLQLAALEGIDLAGDALDSPRRITALIGAAKAAFRVGGRAVADPRAAPEPYAPLLGDEGRRRLAEAMPQSPPNLGGTATLSVVDAAGNAVTIVQSVFLVYGSGILDEESGVLLNNRMIGFTTEPGHPNRVAPRKRPAHTLCPCMVFAPDGTLRYAIATPGGPGQTITLAQVLQAAIEGRVPLDRAIGTPRWSLDLGAANLVEDAMPVPTVEAVRSLGTAVDRAPPGSPFFGSAEGIHRAGDGTLTGVADFRRDAATLGL